MFSMEHIKWQRSKKEENRRTNIKLKIVYMGNQRVIFI